MLLEMYGKSWFAYWKVRILYMLYMTGLEEREEFSGTKIIILVCRSYIINIMCMANSV